jgi:hypothetical protein
VWANGTKEAEAFTLLIKPQAPDSILTVGAFTQGPAKPSVNGLQYLWLSLGQGHRYVDIACRLMTTVSQCHETLTIKKTSNISITDHAQFHTVLHAQANRCKCFPLVASLIL